MRRYTVVWDPDLEADFIRVWTAADSALRAALTHASNWADQHLWLDPDKQGRPSRVDPTWRTVVIPNSSIVVTFRVISEHRQVEVLGFQCITSE